MKCVNNKFYETFFIVLFISLLSFLLSGCRRSTEEITEPVEPQVTSTSTQEPRNDRTKEKEISSPQKKEFSNSTALEPTNGLTAEVLFREMLTAYSKCKVYSDNAYIETVYEAKSNETPKKLLSDRWPASLTFKKPNQVRMAINFGELLCDGNRLYGQISLPIFRSLCLDQPAPLLISSVKDLYPDPRLASAMELGIPTDIFWALPQVVLLLAHEPLKTFIPKEGAIKLLDPAYASIYDPEKGTTAAEPCDRIQITGEDGVRVLWISRNDRSLVRFEFPLEQLAVPENVHRVVRLSMEIPNRILSSDPITLEGEKNLFTPSKLSSLQKVQNFWPSELFYLKKSTPRLQFRPLFTGFSPIDFSKSDNKIRAVCFWNRTTLLPTNALGSKEDPFTEDVMGISLRTQSFIGELEALAHEFENDHKIEFLSVCVDSSRRYSNDEIRSQYSNLNYTLPLYRLEMDELQETFFSSLAFPSLLLIDSNGIIQKYYQSSVSRARLFTQLKKIKKGENVYKEEFDQYETDKNRFAESIMQADLNDLYRTVSDPVAPDLDILPFSLPEQIKIQKAWTVDSLRHPGNPLALEKIRTGAGATSQEESNDDLLVVPCEGNNIVVISASGQILKRVMPSSGRSEPITFLRTALNKKGERFFVASALLETRKIHRFDGNFKALSSMDVGSQNGHWVADVRLHDTTGDGEPEILLALTGDSTGNAVPVHGLYAVDRKSLKILWKDERITTPYRIVLNQDAKGTPNLVAMNHPEGLTGNLVLDDLFTGKRITEKSIDDNSSVIWLASDRIHPGDSREIAVLLGQIEPPRLFLAGLDSDSFQVKWRAPLYDQNLGRQMERILAGDINGDGIKEWILPHPNGTILFYNANGKLLDRFQYGREITGLCVALWHGERYLIVTDLFEVTAWKIDP